jgi:hypothetical protein
MKINMRQLAGSEVLAGALSGRRVCALLLTETAKEPTAPESVFLDFLDVELATASFLRESVLVFRDAIRKRRSMFYPVVANANEIVVEELVELVRSRKEVLLVCTLTEDEQVINGTLIGDLDPKQNLTFNLVLQYGETDAGELMRAHGESEAVQHATAWNNRLAALAARGIIVEISQGRSKRYKPLFKIEV